MNPLQFGDIQIGTHSSCKWIGPECWIIGHAMHKDGRMFVWEAKPIQLGWYIVLYRWSNTKIGIEIMAAISRLG